MTDQKIFRYVFKNDYNKKFVVNKKDFYCYSKTTFQGMHFDESDYCVAGEISVSKNTENIEKRIGTLNLAEDVKLNVFPKGTYKKFLSLYKGYIYIGNGAYICVV